MRRALDNYQPITTVHGQPGYGYFGKHAGYDYGIVNQPLLAPEDGVITAVYLGREKVDGGNIIELRSSKYDHRFLHLKSSIVKAGQAVKEGQKLGVTGNTGNVGYHLHHDTRKKGTAWTDSFSNYVDWEKLIKKGGFVLEEQRPVFVANYYLEQNPDVKRAGYTTKTAVNHWLQYGIKEGRASAPNFHVKEYVANYSDLQKAFGKNYPRLVKHYYINGINEQRSGRKRSPVVNTAQATLDKIKGILRVK